MGLSTHVLDTMNGTPAAGMQVTLYETSGGVAKQVKRFRLNDDGRNPDGPLYDNATLKAGSYRLSFDVAGYFHCLAGFGQYIGRQRTVHAGDADGWQQAALLVPIQGFDIEVSHGAPRCRCRGARI